MLFCPCLFNTVDQLASGMCRLFIMLDPIPLRRHIVYVVVIVLHLVTQGGRCYSFINLVCRSSSPASDSCGDFTVGALLSLRLQPLPVQGEAASSSRWMTTVVARALARGHDDKTRR